MAYLSVLTSRHYLTALSTLVLSAVVTLATLVISVFVGLFLQRNRFPGQSALLAMLTFRWRFPAWWSASWSSCWRAPRPARQLHHLALRRVAGVCLFAGGLFVGYLYFSIPRVILTVVAAAEKLDPSLEEAAVRWAQDPGRCCCTWCCRRCCRP
jgi:putative spermidine/putrescine transport system permease protein